MIAPYTNGFKIIIIIIIHNIIIVGLPHFIIYLQISIDRKIEIKYFIKTIIWWWWKIYILDLKKLIEYDQKHGDVNRLPSSTNKDCNDSYSEQLKTSATNDTFVNISPIISSGIDRRKLNHLRGKIITEKTFDVTDLIFFINKNEMNVDLKIK